MSKSYKEAINKISLSEEMKKSIIKNVSEVSKKNKKKHNLVYLQRISGLAACLIIGLLSYHLIVNYSYTPTNVNQSATNTPASQTKNTDSADGDHLTVANTDLDENQAIASQDDTTSHNINRIKENTKDNTNTGKDNHSVLNNQDAHKGNIGSVDESVVERDPIIKEETPNEDIDLSSPPVASNPTQDLLTQEQIENELGYRIKTPDYIPDGFQQSDICLIAGNLVQITYESENNVICYRTAKGNEDISGDYTSYANIETVTINDCDVTLKGNDAIYYNVSWVENDNSYSVSSSNGFDKETMIDIVENVK